MVPQFSKGRNPIVSHREYVGDITSSIAFTLSTYSLNPGLVATFPWLAAVASQYEQYRFRGCAWEFRSTSASALNSINTALGTVIMATQYDVLDSNFASKLTMENYDMAMSCKPAESMLHGVECNKRLNPLSELYVRNAGIPANADARLYDLGKFQIATVGMQQADVVIGELWVTYEVELIKPKLLEAASAVISPYAHWNSAGSTGTITTSGNNYMWGPTFDMVLKSGSATVATPQTVGGEARVTFPFPGRYMILITLGYATTAPTSLTGTAGTNCTILNALYSTNSASNITSISSANKTVIWAIVTTSVANGVFIISNAGNATTTTAITADVTVVQLQLAFSEPKPRTRMDDLEDKINSLLLLDRDPCPTPTLEEEKYVNLSESTVLARAINILNRT